MANRWEILADRETGMTLQQVAEKHGVSRQYVSVVCGKYNPSYFKYITEEGCIFPNLRRWMNENKVGKQEFLRRMHMDTCGVNSTRLKGVINGSSTPRKDWIDLMLGVTGMTYEKLFAMELWVDDDE